MTENPPHFSAFPTVVPLSRSESFILSLPVSHLWEGEGEREGQELVQREAGRAVLPLLSALWGWGRRRQLAAAGGAPCPSGGSEVGSSILGVLPCSVLHTRCNPVRPGPLSHTGSSSWQEIRQKDPQKAAHTDQPVQTQELLPS